MNPRDLSDFAFSPILVKSWSTSEIANSLRSKIATCHS